jgi:phosphatidylglycerophosphate synthase
LTARSCEPLTSASAPADADVLRRDDDPRIPVKGRDCWWTVLVIDPLAGPLVRVIRGVRWITPDLLTAVSVLLAFGAAVAYALDDLVIGGVLFQASFLVDCMDGKLAALRQVRNPYGGFVDAVGDALRFITCTGALVLAVASSEQQAPASVALLALFPAIHYARLVIQKAWPETAHHEPALVRATPRGFIAAAPRRLSQPGTTVDTEALAFTIGPVLGAPFAGIAAATLIDGCRLLVTLATRLWQCRPARRAGAGP